MLRCYWRGNTLVLLQSGALAFLAGFFAVDSAWSQTSGGAPLTTVAQIRALPVEVQLTNPAVKIRATVTYSARWYGQTESTVQDATGGIYVGPKVPLDRTLHLGDAVEIDGHAGIGQWSPNLAALEVRVLGPTELPRARPVDYPTLHNGVVDSQFVEIEGVVRDVQYDGSVSPASTILSVAMPGGRAEVFLALLPESQFTALIDARVRVRGVVFHYFNARKQIFGFRLMVCDSSQIEVLVPSPGAPFELPVRPMNSLLRFDPKGPFFHRVRVQGVVSLHWPGEFFFLQDGAEGLLVRSRQAGSLKVGDFVDVAAFATMGTYAARLEDAQFRKREERTPPAPAVLALDALTQGAADARLVQVEAELESVAERNGHAFLMLRKGALIVSGELPVPASALPPLTAGSLVRVTGVCQVEVGSQRRFARFFTPESARMLLQSPADIVVLHPAPWWTARRLSMALGSVITVMGLCVAWASSLQRRNLKLRSEIAARQSAEAEVIRRGEERQLLATDLHDSLEQSLTGVALQLRAARDDLDPLAAKNQSHLALAERLLEHSRADVHRAVRDLRQPADAPLDLREAFTDLVRISAAGSRLRVVLEIPGHFPELPQHLSYQLLRLAQESVTNALKHACATRIAITLGMRVQTVTLEVCDDGVGLDPAKSLGPAEGHFGLQGMKERTKRIGGRMRIEAQPGAGTRIIVEIPLPA